MLQDADKEKIVDFRFVFIENALLKNEVSSEASVLDFFKAWKKDFDVKNDASSLEYLYHISRNTELYSLRQEFEKTIKDLIAFNKASFKPFSEILVILDEDRTNLYPESNEYVRKQFLENAYNKIVSESNNVFSYYDRAYEIVDEIIDENYKNNFEKSMLEKMENGAYFFSFRDKNNLTEKLIKKVKENALSNLYSKINEREPVKNKLIEYFENTDFIVSDNESVSKERNIYDAVNLTSLYRSDISNTFIKDGNTGGIVLSANFHGSAGNKMELFNSIVNRVKKIMFKELDEDLSITVNKDLVGAVIVFEKDSIDTPIAIFTEDDFEDELVSWEKLEPYFTVIGADLLKDLEKDFNKGFKNNICSKINSLYKEKKMLDFYPNKFTSKVECLHDFKEIKSTFIDIQTLIHYKGEKDFQGAGNVVIYANSNVTKDTILETVKNIPDLHKFTRNLEKVETDFFKQSEISENSNKKTHKQR